MVTAGVDLLEGNLVQELHDPETDQEKDIGRGEFTTMVTLFFDSMVVRCE